MLSRILLSSCFCFFLCGWTGPSFHSNQLADLSVNFSKTGTQGQVDQNSPNSDKFITDQVNQAFAHDPEFAKEFQNLKVTTKDGVVTLQGKVANENFKAGIVKTAENVPGVKSVNDKIEVTK